MGFLSFLGLGSGNIKNALRKGAIIIDVRTATEYDNGHIPDAFHIPVDRIKANAERLKESKLPIVLCCSSGDRSSTALQILKDKGVKDVYNGGNWETLLRLIKSL
ncbi:MAG: rhodanese-like domain-containing protein [Chitinophagaceae bacterium]|nr:rhodanese-like domain-containing protein [Chitinophagaceae bacterium]